MGTSKLHTKTTLLSSVIIIVAILMAALVLTSAAIANIERTDDQKFAEIQAHDLAQHISDMGSSADSDSLARAANLIKGSRPSVVSVRIWQLSQAQFVERTSASGSTPATPIPESTRTQLLRGSGPVVDSDQSLFRVFAPTFSNGRP
ncbi:MAG TPA: hypothetical protein VIK76_22145, partial [Pyrinomonadaceae bacterium]